MPKRHVGRPLGRTQALRVQLSLKVTLETREIVAAEANRLGIPFGHAAERMIERCLAYDRMIELMKTGRLKVVLK